MNGKSSAHDSPPTSWVDQEREEGSTVAPQGPSLQQTVYEKVIQPANQILALAASLQEVDPGASSPRVTANLQQLSLVARQLFEATASLSGDLSLSAARPAPTSLAALPTAESLQRALSALHNPQPQSTDDVLPRAPEPPVIKQRDIPTLVTTESLVHEIPDSLLVVDDNALNRNVLARHLFRNGYAVCTAEGGREALETLASHPFDLVLLDIVMPELDGITTLEIIRKNKTLGDLPVIMVTSHESSDDAVRALDLGANDYLTKPLDLPLVLARIKTQLALKKALNHVQALNYRLREAHEKLGRIVESAPRTVDEVYLWARSMAADLASAINVEEIGVWVLANSEAPQMLVAQKTRPPMPDDISSLAQSGGFLEREADTLVPALGLDGDLFGLLVIPQKNLLAGNTIRQLVHSFARQLGAALELKHLRNELDSANKKDRRLAPRLPDHGVELLQVCPECGRCYDQTSVCCAADNATLDGSRPLPYRIGNRYRLIQLLGEGGMGTVFHALDHLLDREVAIKVINPSQCGNERARQRFMTEARAIARINHPNIVAVFDCGNVESHSVYLVMERLRGHDTKDMVRAFGPASGRDAAQLLSQCGAALGAAHRAKVIHRDIKPENIFVVPHRSGFQVKLLDFGLAKDFNRDPRMTRTGMIVGTPLFMAPEQAMSDETDHRSDIYSLAAVAFYALSGQHLTKEKTVTSILIDIIKSTPPRLSTMVPNIPPEVDRAFAAALAKNPNDRPSDVELWVESFVHQLAQVDTGVKGWITEDGMLRCAW